MLDPTAKAKRHPGRAIAGLEAGALLFAAGLVLLHLNPFWHFDEGGFLDHRVHWWNGAGEILIGAGLLIEALALLGSAALVVSRIAHRRSWPYAVALLLVVCAVVWVSPTGFVRNLDAHFEWTSSEGFTTFHLQGWDESGGVWHSAGRLVWRSIIEAQIQPLLRSYFKLNDWQRMNGDIGIRVVRIIPIAWPVALGGGGETLEDPDKTALMRAAAREDLTAVHQILSAATDANVNALDQAGQTALILACQNPTANPRVVEALLAAGADVNLRSRDNYTALTWALFRNNTEVIRLLRRANGRP
jgi:hypothetical protein